MFLAVNSDSSLGVDVSVGVGVVPWRGGDDNHQKSLDFVAFFFSRSSRLIGVPCRNRSMYLEFHKQKKTS